MSVDATRRNAIDAWKLLKKKNNSRIGKILE